MNVPKNIDHLMVSSPTGYATKKHVDRAKTPKGRVSLAAATLGPRSLV